jgi:hypothetical protein
MINANAIPKSQRMDITSDQSLTSDDIRYLNEKIVQESKKLKPGWVAAVDFRGMWVTDPFLNEGFQQLQRTLLEYGAQKIGTLLDSDPIRMRLAQAGLKTRSNEITRRFYDPGAWEKFITQS